MVYSKQTWVDDSTPLSALRLNIMEQGIANARVDADYPAAFIYQNAAQSISSGIWTYLTWHVADIDTHTGWSVTTNPTRWTVPAGQGGIYRIDAAVVYTGGTYALVRMLKNGTIPQASWADGGGLSAAGGATTQRIIRLVPGDYIEIQGYTNAATTTRVTTNDGGAPYFMIERIR